MIEVDVCDALHHRVGRGERHPLVMLDEQDRELVAPESERLAALT